MQITGRPAGRPGFYLAALAGVCGRNERDSETPGQRRMPASRGVGRGQLTCQLGPQPLPGGDLEGRGEPWLRGRVQRAGRRVQGAGHRVQGAGLRPQGAGRSTHGAGRRPQATGHRAQALRAGSGPSLWAVPPACAIWRRGDCCSNGFIAMSLTHHSPRT